MNKEFVRALANSFYMAVMVVCSAIVKDGENFKDTSAKLACYLEQAVESYKE